MDLFILLNAHLHFTMHQRNSFHLYGKSTDAGPPASVLFHDLLLLHRGGGGVELLDESAELGRVLTGTVDDGLGRLCDKALI